MKRYLNAVNDLAHEMDWVDVTLLKLATASAGALIGLSIPKKNRRLAAMGAATLCAAFSVPLVAKFIPHLGRALTEEDDA